MLPKKKKNVNTPKAKLGEISLEDLELSPEKLKESHQKMNSQEELENLSRSVVSWMPAEEDGGVYVGLSILLTTR